MNPFFEAALEHGRVSTFPVHFSQIQVPQALTEHSLHTPCVLAGSSLLCVYTFQNTAALWIKIFPVLIDSSFSFNVYGSSFSFYNILIPKGVCPNLFFLSYSPFVSFIQRSYLSITAISLGEGNGYLLQYPCLGNPTGQGSLAGYGS